MCFTEGMLVRRSLYGSESSRLGGWGMSEARMGSGVESSLGLVP